MANSQTPAEFKNCNIENPSLLFGCLAQYLGSDKRRVLIKMCERTHRNIYRHQRTKNSFCSNTNPAKQPHTHHIKAHLAKYYSLLQNQLMSIIEQALKNFKSDKGGNLLVGERLVFSARGYDQRGFELCAVFINAVQCARF